MPEDPEKQAAPHIRCEGLVCQRSSFVFRARYSGRLVMAPSFRISRILFKLAVEQAITMNVVAAACNIGREQLEKLRGTCVAQVKRTNGVYSFEDAFDFQKR